MNAMDIQKVGLWTAIAGAVAAFVVLVAKPKQRLTTAQVIKRQYNDIERKYDDIFGV
jgi:hypothetical protein